MISHLLSTIEGKMIKKFEGKDRSLKTRELRNSRIKKLGNLGINNSSIPKFQNSEIH
jgi:hypothetical protein